jgi:small subunit ribosomal protein S13
MKSNCYMRVIRISGKNLKIANEKKKVWNTLTKIHGIGRPLAFKILKQSGIPNSRSCQDMKDEEFEVVRQIIETYYLTESTLRKVIRWNRQRLRENGSYRGFRHAAKLPSRGQRTATNARTIKRERRSE